MVTLTEMILLKMREKSQRMQETWVLEKKSMEAQL